MLKIIKTALLVVFMLTYLKVYTKIPKSVIGDFNETSIYF